MKKYSELTHQEQLDEIKKLRINEEDHLINDVINDVICVECEMQEKNCWCVDYEDAYYDDEWLDGECFDDLDLSEEDDDF